MKRILLGIIGILIPLSGFSQSLELELIRTESVPGFFAVRIFPDQNLKEINIEDVFVKNFTKENSKNYHNLISILAELDGTIIDIDQLPQYSLPTNRIILLGGQPHGDFIYFKPNSYAQILEEFDDFAVENLGQPILMNITAKFGGNITEVYPKQIVAMTDKPVFFVGKFVEPLKTKMTITALTHEGEIIAETPLHLEKYEHSAFSEALPDIWEEVYQSTLPQKDNSNLSFYFTKAFPWILGILGLMILAFAVSSRSKFNQPNLRPKLPTPIKPITSKNHAQDLQEDIESVPEGFWHQPKEKVEQSMPDNLKSQKTKNDLVKDFYKKSE